MSTNETAIVRANGGALAAGTSVTHTGTGREVARSAEVGVSAIEAKARAEVQARFYMAQLPQNRRLWDDVEQRMFRECQRPRFAATAMYSKPVGGQKITGLSIRFAEAALRVAGNIDVRVETTYDDLDKRVVVVAVLDLESNFGYSKAITVDKIVERRAPDDKREVIYARQNSNGQMVYGVRATDDEVMVKQNAHISKEIRNQGLRLIPGDILDECKAIIQKTVATRDAADPEAARKEILDAFAGIGVMPAQIAEYLEHGTDTFTMSELADLRGVYAAIKTGEAAWRDVMAAKKGTDGEEKTETPGAKKVREAIEKRKPKAPPAAVAPDPHAHLINMDTFPKPESCDDGEVVRVNGALYRFRIEGNNFEPLA